ncbi:MAG TPA: DEAD/DEAH box helicase [Acidimicrobiales bacterium]|nr:DEAD/DEAH box helicase [Acidimicrobiales bacterium]
MARVTAALPAAEDRPGQIEMARAVAQTLQDKGHLIVQAGTGTGKSLGYLVPAILMGVKCVVATATKALQDQLADKDLPFLARHLGRPFDFSVLKGRSNYLCWQRAKEVAGGDDEQLSFEPAADVGELGKEIAAVLKWAGDSPTGDRAELPFEPRPKVWSALSVSARECPGVNQCPSGGGAAYPTTWARTSPRRCPSVRSGHGGLSRPFAKVTATPPARCGPSSPGAT